MTGSAGGELTVVVPTVGRAGALASLLADLAAQRRRLAEVIVVDAMHAEECRELCDEMRVSLPGLAVRHLPAPPGRRGLPASRNYAVEHCATEIVAFLDDDVRVPPDYSTRLLEPFAEAEIWGVGGAITNEVSWTRAPESPGRDRPRIAASSYALDGWRRPLPRRWRWRRRLGLAPVELPGRWSGAGHVWPLSFWPPGDDWVPVDFLMGGASAWRRALFAEIRFPEELEGYGHYEDLIFSLQASRRHRLVLHRGARLEHHHHPAGRPGYRRYGYQVTYNAYSLWRQFRPRGGLRAELGYWLVELLNGVARLRTRGGVAELAGRLQGAVAALRRPLRFAERPALAREAGA